MEKKNTVNFDNSAGTHPKPESVRQAVAYAMRELGGNPGRGGHRLSMAAAERVYAVRKSAAEFFSAETENTAFTPNCTYALNMAIKGLMQFGGHIIISGWEHNSASRPVYALTKRNGVKCSVCEIYPDDVQRTIEGIRRLIRHDTLCVCCMAASNVTGRIMPYHEIGELCRQRGIAFVCDCAQAAGVLPVSIKDGISFICTSGQKGLYGPTGTGLLISSGEFALSTIIEGGTGATTAAAARTNLAVLPLAGGTLTGQVTSNVASAQAFLVSHGTANKDAGFRATRTDTDVSLFFGVGSGGVNHGVYSTKLGKWLVYGDGSNVYCNGTATNVTGTVAIGHGGTGATTAAAARTNLGITCASLYNGSLSSGSITFNYGNYNAYLILGQPGSATAIAGIVIPKGMITTSDVKYQITDESYYRCFNLKYSGSTVTLTISTGSGTVNRVFGLT